MVGTLSIVIILLHYYYLYYREARIYDAHGTYKHTSHVVVSLNSVTLNLKRTLRTYPGSLSFFSPPPPIIYFFFLSGIFYIRRRVLILTHGVLYTQHTACRHIYLVYYIHTRFIIIIIVYDSLSGPPIIVLSISCTRAQQ